MFIGEEDISEQAGMLSGLHSSFYWQDPKHRGPLLPSPQKKSKPFCFMLIPYAYRKISRTSYWLSSRLSTLDLFILFRILSSTFWGEELTFVHSSDWCDHLRTMCIAIFCVSLTQIETQVKKLLSQETCTPETMIKLHVQLQNDICQHILKLGT